MSPEWSLAMVFVFLIMAASAWRRTRIRKAVRNLPTGVQRMLGEAPEYDPPEEALRDGAAQESEALRSYAALHRRVTWIMKAVWGLGLLWMGYVVFLIVGGA